MLRFASTRLAAAAPAAAAKPSKMQTLHKLLVGEMAFKNHALLKESNVEATFGASWKSELADYTKSLDAKQQALVARQLQRLSFTRYTTRELAEFAVNGPAAVDATAAAANLAAGVAAYQTLGEAKFVETVTAEAKLANWTADQTKKFIADVKAAKK